MENVPSVAAQVIVSVIPIVGIVLGCAVIFFFMLWDYKKTVLLIKADRYQRTRFDLLTFCLLAGMLLGFIGLTLSVLLMALGENNMGLLGGLIPLAVGLSLLTSYIVLRNDRRK